MRRAPFYTLHDARSFPKRLLEDALGGAVGGNADSGGGIANVAGATLMVSNSSISGNTTGDGGAGYGVGGDGGFGGGIFNAGTLAVSSSTLSGNTTGTGNPGDFGGYGGFGGGIFNAGTLAVSSSTLSGNTTGKGGGDGSTRGGDGGGLYLGSDANVKSTIVANNTVAPGGSGPDCKTFGDGAFITHGYNLLEETAGCDIEETSPGADDTDIYGQDPQIGPLQDNGGATETQAPEAGSRPVDNGSCSGVNDAFLPADQRFVPRPQGARCDIGAVERRAPYASS